MKGGAFSVAIGRLLIVVLLARQHRVSIDSAASIRSQCLAHRWPVTSFHWTVIVQCGLWSSGWKGGDHSEPA